MSGKAGVKRPVRRLVDPFSQKPTTTTTTTTKRYIRRGTWRDWTTSTMLTVARRIFSFGGGGGVELSSRSDA